MSPLVFLGGTCGNNDWREASFIPALLQAGVPEDAIFNPVVRDWTQECQEAEDQAKEKSVFMVYYLADPKEPGNPVSAYSLVEAVMALYDDPDRTAVVFDTGGMEGHALKAMDKARKDLLKRFPRALIFDKPGRAAEELGKKIAGTTDAE